MGKAISGAALASESHSDLAESETLCMYGNSMLENREISRAFGWKYKQSERLGKVRDHTPGVYAFEKSDIVIVPKKKSNNTGKPLRWRRFWRKGR